MEWLADNGTKNVCIGVREQELSSELNGRHNLRHMCNAVEKAGVDVFVVPSFWGNMMAGTIGTHSRYSRTHPSYGMRDPDGTPVRTGFGPITSVHYPETFDFIRSTAQKLLSELSREGADLGRAQDAPPRRLQ